MAYPVWALVIGSILTTVVLVVINKHVFQAGFPFVMALSTLHFITTFVVMLVLSTFKFFEVKTLPWKINLLVGGMGVASITFMNYSLRFNSVGVYQMAKLCIIPAVLAQQIITKGEYTSRKILASLALVLIGVGGATITDVTVNSVGLFFAVFAIFSTAQYQIWQGSKQREMGLSDMQMTMSISGAQIMIGLVLTLLLESKNLLVLMEEPPKDSFKLTGLIFLSCLLAVSANAHSFALIGRTSAVTWQVVGHGKTMMILVAGYLFYPLPSTSEVLYNVLFVVIAVAGVILYSSVKLNEPLGPEKSRDFFDRFLPEFLLKILIPERFTGNKGNHASDEPAEDLEHLNNDNTTIETGSVIGGNKSSSGSTGNGNNTSSAAAAAGVFVVVGNESSNMKGKDGVQDKV
jgi:solute carrier family 35 protein E3